MTFDQLLRVARAAEGLTPGNLQDVMLEQDPELRHTQCCAPSLIARRVSGG